MQLRVAKIENQAADAIQKLAIHQHVTADDARTAAMAAALHRDHINL